MAKGKTKKITGWIALKHQTNEFGEWSISPKKYFEENGSIPDCHTELEVPGMDEVMDHTLQARDDSDGRDLLEAAGFEIVDEPNWYFEKKSKKQGDKA